MRTRLDRDLEALRSAMEGDARREAARRLDIARTKAAGRRADARTEAEATVERARVEGERLARATAERRAAQTARRAGDAVLAAQRTLFSEFQMRCREAVLELRGAPSGPALRARLEARARAALGPDAVVRDSPDGGVVADLGSRRIDLSLSALAERALEEFGAEVRSLWES